MDNLNFKSLNIISESVGSSFYIFDELKFKNNLANLTNSFKKYYKKTYLGYSYKTNYTPELCKIANKLGCYSEIVSQMELSLVKKLKISLKKVIYNGPYKESNSILEVLIGGGILHVDSIEEAKLISEFSEEYPDKKFRVAIRINGSISDLDYSRFGIDIESKKLDTIIEIFNYKKNIQLEGFHIHLPNRNLESFKERVQIMSNVIKRYKSKINLKYINFGGGFLGKIPENLKKKFNNEIPTFDDYASVIGGFMNKCFDNYPYEEKPNLFIEPGSSVVADTFYFICQVSGIKKVRDKNIATVNGSSFNIVPTSKGLNLPFKVFSSKNSNEIKDFLIGGYTCIESDYLSSGSKLALSIGDFLMFYNVGSYSIVMKPPFILPNVAIIKVDKNLKIKIIKKAEVFNDLFSTFIF